MEWYQILQALVSLVFVIGLLLLCLWLFRYCEQKGFNCKLAQKLKNGQRINILEKKILDSKNQVILLNYQNKDYLILLSPSGSQIIASSLNKDKTDYE